MPTTDDGVTFDTRHLTLDWHILASLNDAPSINLAPSASARQVIIDPRHIDILVSDYVAPGHKPTRRITVEISGPTRKKDGDWSINTRKGRYRLNIPEYARRYEQEPPEWALPIVRSLLDEAGVKA